MIKNALFLEKRNFKEAKKECLFLISITKKLQSNLSAIEKA